jgi:hypothetical protein
MSAFLRSISVAVVLALLGCTAFAPSVMASMTEEVLPWLQEERAHTAELPVFDPASMRSRAQLARQVDAQVATAGHWIDPFGSQEHVPDVAVPPPKGLA